MEPRIDTFVAWAHRPEYGVDWSAVSFPAWVDLRREPNNPHDENAIAVYLKGNKCGYVPATEAAHLAPEIDKGWCCGAFLKKLRSGDGEWWVDIVIHCNPDSDYCFGMLQRWFHYYGGEVLPGMG